MTNSYETLLVAVSSSANRIGKREREVGGTSSVCQCAAEDELFVFGGLCQTLTSSVNDSLCSLTRTQHELDAHIMQGYHVIVSVKTTDTSKTADKTRVFTPKHIFQRLPHHKSSPTCLRASIGQPNGGDYRIGPLRIDWMDFETRETASRRQSNSTGKEKEHKRGSLVRPNAGKY